VPELPLRNLHERHRALTVAVGGSYEEAAAVCLQRHHQPPTELTLSDNGAQSARDVSWTPPNERTRGAWANTTDATEAGACACVIAGVETLRGLLAVRRAETGTGADYYIGPLGAGANDLEDCRRLEVSGVDQGDEREVLRRLNQKVRQARDGSSSLPALAGVIGFAERLLVIQDVSEL
jgi:hypothetical protein